MVIRVAPSGSVNCEVSGFRIVVDPAPRERGEMVLKTAVDIAVMKDELTEVIVSAGEYEHSGVKVSGFDMEGESDNKTIKTTYKVEADGVRMCFLAPLTKEPTDAFLEKLGDVDILFVGLGKGLIEPKKAATVIREIEPRIIIPRNDDAAKDLTSEFGKPEQMDRLTVKRKDFENEEGTKFVWIKEK
ncbi:MAG: MBL fold metallo-hydrolase [Patescibacteria group bacterium]|nr:MBL fold metallo-hydrolase [Patescibacteria group bacterium]MCL5224099.1 MBL fold metallo-hydrolase [Patescibacteria group bacterium]